MDGKGRRIPARRIVLTALMAAASPAVPVEAQRPTVTISGIRAGFQGIVKPGYWLPVTVDIETRGTDFRGRLQLMVPDSDDLDTSIFREVFVGRDQSEAISHFVKPGGINSRITAQLIDAAGQIVARGQLDPSSPDQRATHALQAGQSLIISLGGPSGLRDDPATDKVAVSDPPHVFASLLSETELPTQWFAYGSVEYLVMATGNAEQLDRLDAGRAGALRTWVRQGGQLVVCVANNWQIVGKSHWLGPMLPARLTGVATLNVAESLEVFAGSKARLMTGPGGLPIAELIDVKGTVLVRQDKRPLVVRGAYGLGTVTLVAFDTDSGPFRQWAGARDFWGKLLGLQRVRNDTPEGSNVQSLQRLGTYGVSDLATVLCSHLENFPNVTVVSFGWVALLIFFYILLIGPVDYFFLKKVVGRLELTWITFPTWVVVISVAAYYSAYWLKGDALRLNRIDIVDVDHPSRTLRGTGFLSIFSPRIDTYTIAMTPQLGAGGTWAELGMGRDQADHNCSWLGVPEDAFRSLYGRGSVGLLGRKGYAYIGSEATAVENVPIKVWSVGTFTGRWLAQAAPILDGELRAAETALVGTVINRLDKPLHDVLVAYGNLAYELGVLQPNTPLELTTKNQRVLSGLLGDQGLARISQERFHRGGAGPRDLDVGRLVRILTFAARSPERAGQLPNRYHRDLDLSDQLELGRAVLIARVEAPGGQLWLGAAPETQAQPPAVQAETRQDTFLRIIVEPKRTQP
jgi:hypothetical protein